MAQQRLTPHCPTAMHKLSFAMCALPAIEGAINVLRDVTLLAKRTHKDRGSNMRLRVDIVRNVKQDIATNILKTLFFGACAATKMRHVQVIAAGAYLAYSLVREMRTYSRECYFTSTNPDIAASHPYASTTSICMPLAVLLVEGVHWLGCEYADVSRCADGVLLGIE